MDGYSPWTAAYQAPLSLGFSRQEYWSGLLFPSPMHESEEVKVKLLSHARIQATKWTAAHQGPTLEPQLENTDETPQSSGDEGLLLLYGLENNPESSLQTPQEA